MDLDQVIREVDESADKGDWASGEYPGPVIFHVNEEENGELSWFFPDTLNDLFIRLCVERGMDPSDALVWIAERTEKVADSMARWGFDMKVSGRMRGIGMRSDAWALDAPEEGWDGANLPDEIEGHPAAKEIRMVQYYDRSGLVRTMLRELGSGEAPRMEDDHTTSGGIPHAMSRILNAMVEEDVPIRSAHHPGCDCPDE